MNGRHSSPQKTLIFSGLLLLVLFLLSRVLQWKAHALDGPFVSDAAAHLVSSLLVRDWLQHGLTENPLRFVIDYHAHLPMTGIGIWPPMYYAIGGVWFSLFGVATASAMALSAMTVAALGGVAAALVARRAGWTLGCMVGLLLVANPLSERAADEFMLDIASALACLLAALSFARFVQKPSWANATWFGAIAAAALYVKYNVLGIALMPPLTIAIGRRWDLLKHPALYWAGAIVAILAGPWYLKTHGIVEQGFRFSFGWTYISLAVVENAKTIVDALTPMVSIFAMVGVVRTIHEGRALIATDPLRVVCLGLAAAIYVFLLLVPVALQDRYLLPCIAPLAVLAAVEVRRLFDLLTQPAVRWGGIALLAVVTGYACWPTSQMPRTTVQEAAAAVRRDSPIVVLAVGDAVFEPAMLAAFAQSETKRPSSWIVRGSRLFGGGGYNNADYLPKFNDPQDLLGEIDRYGVQYVFYQPIAHVHNEGGYGWIHVNQFGELLGLAPDRFEEVLRTSEDPAIRVFRVKSSERYTPDAAALTELSGPKALMRMVR